ncbi:[cytidine(C)-cytidine(C)-adenosine (A)]-adding enzyme, partial [Paenibacillus apiarius]|nr:[cytidine(C)-cytidine(C)-adenosine (A)]-adding enzyme [Paenibacillus apiarius]MCY9520716.1 [cytidine(C)-cytidine(C)-adenosine (A)]-adding enzyme [Paenibacillus apiarius]
ALAAAAVPGGALAWRRPFAQALFAIGEEALRGWLACRSALAGSGEPEAAVQPFLQHGHAWLEDIAVRRLQDIALTGSELLQAAGRAAGPWLRRSLEAAWLAVALQEVPNEREALLKYAVKEWKER